MRLPLLTILFFLFLAAPCRAEEPEQSVIEEWLHLGPVHLHSPVYHQVPDLGGQTWSTKELLHAGLTRYRDWSPAEGVEWNGPEKETLTWTAAGTENGLLALPVADDKRHTVHWAAVYVTADRWVPAELTLESPGYLRVFRNGLEIISKTTAETGNDTEPGSVSVDLELKKGSHLLLVKSVYPAEAPEAVDTGESGESSNTGESGESGEEPGNITLKATLDAGEHAGAISAGPDPARTVMQRDLSNAPRPVGASVSPDGALAAIHVLEHHPPEGESETRIDIRHISDGTLYRRYSGGMRITGMQWVPDGRRFSYTAEGNEGTDLWVVDLETGDKERILRDIEDFAGYRWSPDAEHVIYRVSERHEPGEEGVMRYHGLQDRRPGYHTRTYLYQLHVEQGTTRRLTAGRLSTSLGDIHPDGNQILYLRSHEDYEERPYSKTEYVILDLQTMTTDSLFTLSFGGSAQFSPAGDRLLITGGPNAFGDIGVNVPDTLIANDYDTQVYIYHRESGETESITLDFDPSVSGAGWDETGRYIYFTVTEKAYRNIYRYDTRRERFEKFETGPDVAGSLDLAKETPVAVFTGSGASDTPKVWTIDFTRSNPRASVLYDPAAEAYAHVSFGEIRPWTFTNDFGEQIDGHVYYPPDFDETREYPVIVYYYGGTSPTSRAYGGRYPKELYASKGYLVYVLQPSGATGFGQEFSARHVNDWGKIAGNEIITGVTRFLEEHNYADRDRVGAIGASYGGFMTMYLLTQTDLFATAVSHAGISNLTSYWGEGFWGYQYSGVATAGSFPWNRRDIYVERSPVFHADAIHTPLLLVTGMSDTNVPPGESLQMFTALKLLGRDVAFVAVEDQNHHILDYKKFILWKDAILSWFDKWLKDEPEWWRESFER